MDFILTALIGLIFGVFGVKGYLKWTTGICRSLKRLDGKVAVITGANNGIGFETAKDLSQRGATVILACRNMSAASKACDAIKNEVPEAKVVPKYLDVSSLKSVRAFASEIKADGVALDILVANAGVALDKKETTDEGLDMSLATNHLGHFLLIILLLEKMTKPGGRIILVSSRMHTFVKEPLDLEDMNSEKEGWDNRGIYDKTKLYNILFMRELHKRIKESPLKDQVTVNALHPGAVKTPIFRHAKKGFNGFILSFLEFFFKTAWEGAQTTIHLAVSDDVEGISGEYWSDCKISETSKLGKDMTLAKRVWDKSIQYIQLRPEEDYLSIITINQDK